MTGGKKLHLIPNAHLDPVFLWAWQEGYNESMATFRSMVELMDRYPELTFVHGEAQSYEPVEKYDPELFGRISELVAAGRWELPGSAYVQSDNNFPATATFLRQFRRGRDYFQEKFGVTSEVGWSPDSAGHPAGLPEIFAAAGLRYFAFARPPARTKPMRNDAFVFRGRSGAEILCCRIWPAYVSEKATTGKSIEDALERLEKMPQHNFMFCIGTGNHGGGTTARMVEEILDLRHRHPEWEIRFSTLGGFFAELEAERSLLPVEIGEVNHTLRGDHTSNAKVKHKFRDLEAAVSRASAGCAVIHRALGLPPVDFSAEWDVVLFNSFHDIIPGDGIDRSNRIQIMQMAGAIHSACVKEFAAVDDLISRLDVPVPPAFAFDQPTQVPHFFFNPRPTPFHGYVELESSLDYRPVFEYANRMDDIPYDIRDEQQRSLPFQQVDPESGPFELQVPFRKRGLLKLDIPAFGYRLVYLGVCAEKPAPPPVSAVCAPTVNRITNGIYTVTAENDRLVVERDGKIVFNRSGIEFATYRDRYGCWGAMDDAEEAWTCREKVSSWRIAECKVLEHGPERAKLFVRFEGGKSLLYLNISLLRERDAVDFDAVLNWGDRGIRLRMMFDPAEAVTYQVPGGEITRRGELGDVPGGRWLEAKLPDGVMGLASDHFSGFAAMETYFSVIMLRGTFTATGQLDVAEVAPERIPCDLGEHRFRWSLTAEPGGAKELAEAIEYPPFSVQCWKHRGKEIPCSLTIEPAEVRLLDMEADGDGLRLSLQNCSDAPVEARISGRSLPLAPWQIVEYRG